MIQEVSRLRKEVNMASRDQLRKLNSSPIVFGGLLAGAAIGSVLPVGALLGALGGTILAGLGVLTRQKGSDTPGDESDREDGTSSPWD